MGRCLGNCNDDIGKIGLSLEVNAVGGDLDAGHDKLSVALFVKLPCLLCRLLYRQAAHPATGVWDDAVGAEIDAAVLNFQKRTGVTRNGAGGQLLKHSALKGLIEHFFMRTGKRRIFDSFDEFHPVAAAEHDIGAELFGGVGAKLRIAAGHGDDRTGVFLTQTVYRLTGLAPCLGGDGAGVDDDGIGALAL